MRSTIVALAIPAIFGACLVMACATSDTEPKGVLPSKGGATSAGEAMFVAKVYPELQLTCAFCHAAANNPVNAPQWMGFNAKTSYESIETYEGLISYPDNSKLLLKGEHTGPALTPSQHELVREWLELEAKARGIAPPAPAPDGPPALSADDALEQFGKCMSFEDFKEHKVDLLAYMQTTGWGPCRGCHNTGWGGAFIDDDAQLMFDQTRIKPFILKLVGFSTEAGSFKDLTFTDRFIAKGTEACSYSGEDAALCHPKYTLIPKDVGGPDLEGFFDTTYDRWIKTQGKCDGSVGGGGAGGEGGGGGAGGGQ